MSDPPHEEAAMPYNPSEVPGSGIDGILRQHQRMLLARPGVTGVAVGKSPTGDPAIVVYLLDKSDRAGLPQTLDGYPVVVQVTGPITTQPR
jgi:hypothetical protein